jgi:multiple sugar transport system substrate-binding protein
MPRPSWFRYCLTIVMVLILNSCSSTIEIPDTKGVVVDQLLKPMKSPATNKDMKILRFWTFHQAQEFDFMQSLAVQFQILHPNIEVKLEYISGDDYFSGTRLMSAFATGQGPDIFLVSPGNIKKFADANMLQPLTSKFTPEIIDDFYENAIEGVTINREIYAVPFEMELLGLYYNKKMFEDQGLLPPATWNDMMNAAQQLTKGNVSGLTIETFGSVYQNFTWLPFLWQSGADVLAEDGVYSGLNQPNAIRMYDFFQQMREKGLLNMYPSRPTNDIGILANGETAMQISGSWNVRMIESIYSDVPIGVVPLPVPEGGTATTIAGGWKIAVNRHSENVEEAARFVMWAFAEDTTNPLKWCSEVKFAYSPRKSVMQEGKDYYKHGLRSVFTNDIFGTERAEPRLSSEIGRIFTESLQNLLYNRYTGEEAARKASEKINSVQSTNFRK